MIREALVKSSESEISTRAERLAEEIAALRAFRRIRARTAPRRGDVGRAFRRFAHAGARGAATTGVDRPDRSQAAARRNRRQRDVGATRNAVRRHGRDRGDLRAAGGDEHDADRAPPLAEPARRDGGAGASATTATPYAGANVAFHTAVLFGAHNEILADFARSLRRRLAPFRRAQFRADGRLARSHAEHAVVVKAILACDAAAAHAAMFHHMSLVEDSFGQLGVASRASA